MHENRYPPAALFAKLSALAAVALGVAACSPSEGTGGGAASQSAAPPVSADGWQTLFDGTHLDFWNQVGDANWALADGAVRADSGTGFLVSKADYANFDLSLEFWVDVEANSGVFLRCSTSDAIGADTCYEVNIFDTRADQTYRTGAIVDYAAPSQFIYTGGRWNSYEITADGTNLRVTLNDIEVVDTEDSTYANGPIALQYGAGTVMFRNVRIRTR
jgi:3-keto-disaccharide hydrolase